MPSSTVRSFSDSDEYAGAIRASAVELTVTARGQFTAKHTRIDLHDLWMQRFSETLPRVIHSVGPGRRVGITFRTQPGPSLRWNHVEVLPSTIVRHSENHDAFQRSSGGISFGAMSLPREEMTSVASALAGCDLAPPRDELSVTPPPSAMAQLQRLHAEAGYLAETTPDVITHPGAARGLEQALIQAMIACLGPADVAEDSSAKRRHSTIMRRFHRTVAAHPGEAIYIPELCAAVGVSQRTLNLCCHESLGVGPKRYLLLRRMHLARQALRRIGGPITTVSDVAANLGFWNFGRFAVEYKAMFGERPSATLHRSQP